MRFLSRIKLIHQPAAKDYFNSNWNHILTMSYIFTYILYLFIYPEICGFFRSYLITQYSHRFKSSYSILPRVLMVRQSSLKCHPWNILNLLGMPWGTQSRSQHRWLECGRFTDDYTKTCGDLWGEWWSDPLSCRIKFNSPSTCWIAIMYFWFWDELSTWSGFRLMLVDFASKGWDSEQFQLFCAWAFSTLTSRIWPKKLHLDNSKHGWHAA